MAAPRKLDRKGTLRDAETWEKLVNTQFEGNPILSGEDSLAAARKLYRHAMGKAWTGRVQLVSGNRYTWVRRGVLHVNPDKSEVHARGLRAIIHDLSHYAHRWLHPNDAPHSIRQARLERDLARFAVARGWHEGKPVVAIKAPPELAPEAPEYSGHLTLPPAAKAKPDRVAVRYARLVARRNKYATELARATRLLAKVTTEVKVYERRHKERLVK